MKAISLNQFPQNVKYNIKRYLEFCENNHISDNLPYEDAVKNVIKFFELELKNGIGIGTINARKCGILKYYNALRVDENPAKSEKCNQWLIEHGLREYNRGKFRKSEKPSRTNSAIEIKERNDSHLDLVDICEENNSDKNSEILEDNYHLGLCNVSVGESRFEKAQKLLNFDPLQILQEMQDIYSDEIHGLTEKLKFFEDKMIQQDNLINEYELSMKNLLQTLENKEADRNGKERRLRSKINDLEFNIVELQREIRSKNSKIAKTNLNDLLPPLRNN
eukprot:NODE_48_length_31852_cov_1.054168.p15 type:complete len:277 gc:universal NODE_48_length_31852_cov_1.054168:9274-10104(+)